MKGVHSRWSLEEEVPGKILQVPFVKISVEDRAQDLLETFSVEAAVQDPCVSLPVQGVYRRSPRKIFVRDFKVRSLFKMIPEQDLCSLFTKSLYKISKRGLLARSLYKIATRALLARSLSGTAWQDLRSGLCKRSLGKTSWTRSL